MKTAFYTLGCKTNQFETQALERLFEDKGFEIVPFSEHADVYVINTCSVTAMSDKKSRAAIRRARAMSPNALIAVCGCSAQASGEEAVRACGADIVMGVSGKSRLVSAVEDYIKTHKSPALPCVSGFDFMPAGGLSGRTRALLKVQDGCRNFCTYCIIPFLRGGLSSLPLPQAESETLRLKAEGYREIVLTGIEISSYGLDLPETPPLFELIKTVCIAAGDVRVRLGSLEPRTVTEEWTRGLSQFANLCPHFHLSLQSGCDRTLKAMGRRYTAARYLESVRILREYFPGCAITTDLIVGFPGETDADFTETLDFLRVMRPAQVHIFPYSRRRGTRAYSMSCQLSAKQKETRAAQAAKLCAALRAEYLSSLVGKELSVLFETEEDGISEGHCGQYAPVLCEKTGLHNLMLTVLCVRTDGEKLFGTIKEK